MFGKDAEVLRRCDVVGAGRRAALCPTCHSTDRERLIALFLDRHRELLRQPATRLLHVAPEERLAERLREWLGKERYTSGDIHPEHYDRPVMYLDVENLPFDNWMFDVVVCNHVLEHVCDDAAALHEIYRVLRPGGIAILQVPIAKSLEITRELGATTDEERVLYFGQRDHRRLYGRDYASRLAAAGFDVTSIPAHDFGTLVKDHLLNPRETLFVGTRSTETRRPHDLVP